ncbi:MAG: carbohydrate kinase family protein [Candidatus Helarchaeota archaeon]
MIEIFGIGSCNLDHVLLIDRFPSSDEKVDASEYILTSGGVIGNYLTQVSRLGVQAGFIGAFGDDEAGQILLKDLSTEGIDTSLTRIKKGQKTAETFILINRVGEKVIIQSPYVIKTRVSVPDDFNQADFDKIARARLLHTSYIHGDVSSYLVKQARDNNPEILISFDLEKQVIVNNGADEILNFLDLVDILVPQKLGIMELTGINNPIEATRALMQKKVNLKVIVVTLGEDGCRIFFRENDKIKEKFISGFKIQPKDVTGAGDAFNAAFGVGYLKGWDLDEIALFANAAGALNCLQVGARTGMAKEKKIIEFIRENGREFSS